MCGLFLREIIKGFHHYARILIFLSWFWELFWEFLQVQLLVSAFSEQVIKENNTLRLKNKEDGT